jgi:hypothetical protein
MHTERIWTSDRAHPQRGTLPNPVEPAILTAMMRQVFIQMQEQGNGPTVRQWIGMCLSNFTGMPPADGAPVWALTCLFLSSSADLQLRMLANEHAQRSQPDVQLFLVAGLHFFHSLVSRQLQLGPWETFLFELLASTNRSRVCCSTARTGRARTFPSLGSIVRATPCEGA